MITLFITFIFSFSAFAEAPPLGDLLRNEEKSKPKWSISRLTNNPADAVITSDRITINFNNRNVRFEIPLRPDLFKAANNITKPLLLDENDQEVLEFFEKEDSPAEQKALAEMSPLKRNQYLKDKAHRRIALFAQKEKLEERLANHEADAAQAVAKIRAAYREYDSLTFEEKSRVNEMRRRVLKGVAQFLTKKFRPGVYRVGANSLDVAENAEIENVETPKLTEKMILKILNFCNVELFYLGKSILERNEFGWAAIGGPAIMFRKLGWSYLAILNIGYHMDADRVYIRVGTTRQRPSFVAGASVNVTFAPVGFYAATFDAKAKKQVFDDVYSFNPPVIPTIGFASKELTMVGVALPAIPVGPWIIPTSFIPYPLSEFSFYNTRGPINYHVVGSFAVKKFKMKPSKNPNAPQILTEETIEMPVEAKKTLIQQIAGMAQFWKKKECQLNLIPVTQEKAAD